MSHQNLPAVRAAMTEPELKRHCFTLLDNLGDWLTVQSPEPDPNHPSPAVVYDAYVLLIELIHFRFPSHPFVFDFSDSGALDPANAAYTIERMQEAQRVLESHPFGRKKFSRENPSAPAKPGGREGVPLGGGLLASGLTRPRLARIVSAMRQSLRKR